MDASSAYGLIVLFLVGVYVIGDQFIDKIFNRKEEIINRMTEKGEV